MKHLKLFLALAIATLFLAACTKDGVSGNKVTVNGASYTNVKATYDIQGRQFFLQLALTEDGKTSAFGMLDTNTALGEDQKGRTITIPKDGGYGDWLFLEVTSSGGVYTAVPASGKQTFKQKDSKHYEINLDAKDEKGKDLKVKVVAEFKEFKY